MSEQNNTEEAKAAIKEQLNSLKNKKYPDWDNIVIQLCQGDEGLINIRMMRQDMEAMEKMHGQERHEIIELMIQSIEDELKNKDKEEK